MIGDDRMDLAETMDIFGASSKTSVPASESKQGLEDLTYDAAFKRIFSRKEILAGILINTIPDYKNLEFKEVVNLIKSSSIDEVRADITNVEDVGYPKKVIYDILVECGLPGSDGVFETNIFVDLEMQRRYKVNYSMVQRAIYHASRVLSGQLNKGDLFNKLRPVYTIWICMYDTPKELQNTVCSFRMSGTNSDGLDIKDLIQQAQLINVDFMFVSENYDWDADDATVIKFLQSIFKNNLDSPVFNPYIAPTSELRKEVELLMTRDQELLEEREQDRAEGREEGRAEGIKILTETLIELGQPREVIVRRLQDKFNLDLEQAEEYFNTYSEN